jgi:hypothetical protein
VKQVVYSPWIVLLVMLLFTGCTLDRQTEGNIENLPVDAPVPTQAQAVEKQVEATPSPVLAASNATIRVEAEYTQIEVGQPTNIDISIESNSKISDISFNVSFDPAQLEFVSNADGLPVAEIESTNGAEVQSNSFSPPLEIDNINGLIKISAIQTTDASQVTVKSLTFVPKSGGTATISLSNVVVRQGDQLANVTVQNAQITIVPPLPTLTPTWTPIPTVTPTPTATPFPPIAQPVYIPQSATVGFCYRVQPGETIETVCMHDERCTYRPAPFDITRANDLEPPFYLKPQQTIFIPTRMGNGPNVYAVKLGDQLEAIAERCKLPVTMLAKVNNLEQTSTLYKTAGQTVQLADGSEVVLPTDKVVVNYLVIPVPPFPPPSRYDYPTGPFPFVPYNGEPYPIHKDPFSRLYR